MHRPGGWLLIGIAIAFVIGLIAVLTLTQTRWGRGQILGYTLSTLGGRLNGVLSIEELAGNMFTGARLYGVALRDHDGAPLAVLDSAYIQYRVASFVGGDMFINRLAVWNAEITLFKMPGDTLWNYQEILQDPDPDPSEPEDVAATFIGRLLLSDSRVSIRSPLEADSRLSPDEQRAELDVMLADTSRWMIEEVPGGYLRSMLIDVDTVALRELFIGPDERGGIYFEVEDAVADVRLWKDPPLELRSLVAQLHLQEGIVGIQAETFELPNSSGEAIGSVDISGPRPMYDIAITAPEFALADLRWLYPWLPADPAEARGSGNVWLQDRPDDLLFLARGFVLEMPGTRVTGDFGIVSGVDTFRFVNVDLEADPVDMDEVERLLPEGLPVEGLELGSAVVSGTE
jgi:hypothetical protein